MGVPLRRLAPRLRDLTRAILHDDEASIEAAVLEVARSRRLFAPLTFLVGAVVLLIQGLRVVYGNWRLFLLQVLPAMWIWFCMLDLKLHLFRGRSFGDWHGAPALLLSAGIVAVTMATYYLNAVFAFAVVSPRGSPIRPAFAKVREHLVTTVGFGAVIGLALAGAAVFAPRAGEGWFAVSLGVVIAVMMVTYVTFPAHLIGLTSRSSGRKALEATLVGGVVGAVVCTPAYVLGRIGILLLGSHSLWLLGVILVCLGFGLQAGANGAVKAVKMSVKLAVGRPVEP